MKKYKAMVTKRGSTVAYPRVTYARSKDEARRIFEMEYSDHQVHSIQEM
jgi:hypothetical protein